MWMPALITRAPLALARSAAGISAPSGGEDDRAVELLRRRLLRGARPLGAEPAGEGLRLLVALAGEGEDAAALVDGDLAEDVGGGAEAVEADPLGLADQAQRPVADQPGAEQRRRLRVRIAVGDRQAEALVGDGQLGVAAVDVVAGEAGVVAEVLAAAAAVAALAVGPAEPGDADPLRRSRSAPPPPPPRPRCRRSGGRGPAAASARSARRRGCGGRCGRRRRRGPRSGPGRGRAPGRAARPAAVARRPARGSSLASVHAPTCSSFASSPGRGRTRLSARRRAARVRGSGSARRSPSGPAPRR